MGTGLVVSLWNRWVEAEGGEGAATLAGVKAGKLNCYLDGYQYRDCRDDLELGDEVSQRKSLLESLHGGKPDSGDNQRFRHKVERWKGLALGFLPEIYALRGAIDSINQRYFDGQQILFSDSEEGLDQLLALVEKTVDIYNDALAGDIERLEKLSEGQDGSPLMIDRARLVEAAREAVMDQVAYMVDMAKADALDMLGETRLALELVDRHA